MAFAPPDPKRVEADRRRIQERKKQDIAILEAERRIKREIRSCYHEYSPAQIRNAGKMLQYHNDGAFRVRQASNAGIVCWERIGRSNGGKQRGNLYRCLVKA